MPALYKRFRWDIIGNTVHNCLKIAKNVLVSKRVCETFKEIEVPIGSWQTGLTVFPV